MRNLSSLSDEEFCEQVAEEIYPQTVRAAFEKRYKRGWQRRLASNLGVADSTLSGWLKTGDFPTWAKLGIGLLLIRDQLSETQAWRVIDRGGSYEICSFEGQTGHVVARDVKQLDHALLIAAAPALFDACSDAWPVFDDAVQSGVGFEGWEDLAQNLGNALVLARPSLGQGTEPNQEQESGT